MYAFPAHHFGRLGQLAGQPVGPGFMGENLTVTGVTEHDVRIGDVWAWGPARLQVTAPRGPCYKFGIRMGKQAARTAIRQEGMVGWYLRVLVPGEVPVRGPLTVADRHPAGVTVAQVHAALQRRDRAFPELAAQQDDAAAKNQAAASNCSPSSSPRPAPPKHHEHLTAITRIMPMSGYLPSTAWDGC